MRDSMVGLMPSSSASSLIPIGPRRATVPSTESWLGLKPTSATDALSWRDSRPIAARSRVTSSASM